jgi:acyl-CoA dehydrogenase
MLFEYSQKTQDLIAKLQAFVDANILPVDHEVHAWNDDPANRWKPWPGLEPLKDKAKAAGLWNLFLPEEYGEYNPGLTNLEYAPLAEIMGHNGWCSEVFNCSAPDTGNMEVFAKFGTDAQKQQWLEPLLAGEIRSVYMMTEPDHACSDATNVRTKIRSDGDDYVINGKKWWISGIMDPRCKVLLLMGQTNPENPRHSQQSTVIIPRDTPGVEVIRAQKVFGDVHSPGGHCEVHLKNVRIPKENIILGEGRGCEIAQGGLGPGRIHHCMRSIGSAQLALELMCQRATERKTFGRMLSDRSSIRMEIAKSYCDIEQARLLTLKAADAIDRHGAKNAKGLIGAIKVVAPQMAQTVADRAIQIFGGMGVSDDVPLASILATQRFIRLADGPDEVHASQLGKFKIGQYAKPGAGWNPIPTD